MRVGTSPKPQSSKWRLSPRAACMLIVLVVFGGTFAIRHMGLLQFLEFYSYDFFILRQPKAATSDSIRPRSWKLPGTLMRPPGTILGDDTALGTGALPADGRTAFVSVGAKL